jgi:hypothetical protein
MVRYTVTCCKCKAVRRYEEITLGCFMDQAETDGWESTGKMTFRVCTGCREKLPDDE